MKHAADRITGKFAHVEGFLNHSLAGERRVTMDQNAKNLAAIAVAETILLRTHSTQHDWIDKFQVARVEAKREMNFSPIAHCPIAAMAEVMFHVAALRPHFGFGVGEFLKNLAWIFADNMGQHVETAAMAHPMMMLFTP